jgi:hypothetical protein
MPEINPLASDFLGAQAAFRALGVRLSIYLGDYCINFENGSPSTAVYTSDFQEALRVAHIMADHVQTKAAPLGPTGRRMSRRALMYRHNRKIAARRRRQEEAAMILVELHQKGNRPTVRRVPPPYLLRLAVVEAYRQGLPIPATVDEATAFLRGDSPRFWTFYGPDEADKWAESYEGAQGEAVRQAVKDFVAGSYSAQPEDEQPELNEVI